MNKGFDYKEFGEFVKNMRKSIGWNQVKLSKHFKVAPTTIIRMEKGEMENTSMDLVLVEHQLRELVKREMRLKRLA